jgi:PAS domain S-box-containing protein
LISGKEPGEREEKVNILLVDDRPDGLLALEAVLSCPDYNLVSASSGIEALARLLEDDFAVILLDVQMPGMDGFETASLIKGRERCRDTPIIFVTAISKEPLYIYQGYESGGVDYLFKPFEPAILRSKVAVFVDLHRKSCALRRQAEQLRRSEEWNRLLIESARDIVMVLSSEMRIVCLNAAFEILSGWEREEWIGKPVTSLIAGTDASVTEAQLRAVARDGPVLFESHFLNRAGRLVTVETSAIPLNTIPLNNGEPACGILCVVRDVSSRKQVEEERRRRDELERSNRDLENFAYICSHDLQEPLRQVVSFAQLLERKYLGSGTSGQDEVVRHIVDGATRMRELVQAILQYSRIGAHDVSFEPTDMERVLNNTLANIHFSLEETGAVVTSDPLPTVIGNGSHLARLFQNLLGNALKFRGKEPPRVHVSAQLDGGEWRFAVTDNGIGFEMAYAEKIFMMFRRLHRREDFPGSGMGLTICKRIIERHGGRIWVQSTPEAGTTFFFTLRPADAVPAPEHAAEHPAERPTEAQLEDTRARNAGDGVGAEHPVS